MANMFRLPKLFLHLDRLVLEALAHQHRLPLRFVRQFTTAVLNLASRRNVYDKSIRARLSLEIGEFGGDF